MYREAGFEPSPEVCRDGFLDLIAGRIYMDLSRAPEMFFEGILMPTIRSNSPGIPTRPKAHRPCRAGQSSPDTGSAKRPPASEDDEVGGRLRPHPRRRDHPGIEPQWVADEKQRDLQSMDAAQWRKLWEDRRERALHEFGAKLMLPSLIAAMALEELRSFCAENFWDAEPAQLANELSCGPCARSDASRDARAVGNRTREDHGGSMARILRTSGARRVRPRHAALARASGSGRVDGGRTPRGRGKPGDRHRKRMEEAVRSEDPRAQGTLDGAAAREFDKRLSPRHIATCVSAKTASSI